MKKLQILLMILAAILFIGTAQTATAQKRKPNKRTTTTSPRKKPTTTTQPPINVNFKGELGRYELRGAVKTLEIGQYDVIYFNRDGFMTDEKGKLLAERGIDDGTLLSDYTRDSQGRIVQEMIFNGGFYYYKFNTNGLLSEKKYERGTHVIRERYIYNSDGECIKNNRNGVELGEKWKDTITYTILSRDSQGNWTKRKDSEGNIETRKITYYE